MRRPNCGWNKYSNNEVPSPTKSTDEQSQLTFSRNIGQELGVKDADLDFDKSHKDDT